MGKTILIVACEQSGDNYGALLARELRKRETSVRLIGLGGSHMQAAGVELLANTVEHAASGIAEIVGELRFYFDAMKKLEAAAVEHHADAAVLIDSPEFNLRAAPRLKRVGTKVAYYVSPQLWAWRSSRVEIIRRSVDRMMVIFPFEQPWYEERGVTATFVGHPMLDLFDLAGIRAKGEAFRRQLGASPRSDTATPANAPLIGLLPGSRRNEITRLLPRFLEAAKRIRAALPHARFALGCAPWLTPERLAPFLRGYESVGVKPLYGQTHELMSASDYLLVASGTATLEAGVIGTPMLMAYVFSPFSALIGKLFFDEMEDIFCMPNIILGRRVIEELVQYRANPVTLSLQALDDIGTRLPSMRRDLASLEQKLGGPGASARAADCVLELANGN